MTQEKLDVLKELVEWPSLWWCTNPKNIVDELYNDGYFTLDGMGPLMGFALTEKGQQALEAEQG